ncbi:MAG TPA: hypothetical protein VHD63_17195 [Ktedonobacteraceae bacterium]|nr:hypothetical protein [Ktedonobacteraceae bacterium]
MSLTLNDIESAVRLDLFDPAGASQRWATSDIDRAIDKAVDRYTQYYPNINWVDMNTEAYQRTYPYPTPANPSYPVLWIERILMPLQVYGSFFSPPATVPGAAAGSAGNVNGTVQYCVTFISQGGETTPGPATSITVANQQVQLSNIPLGATQTQVPAIATNTVTGRNIYRTQAGGSTFSLLATIQDNTTTTFTDNGADSSLAGQPSPPSVNTSGVMYWPPFERNFSEFSNLFDSTYALAAGGNMGAQGAVGTTPSQIGAVQQTFTLKIGTAELPQDNTLVMRVFYATKHQLDTNGTTIPEIHRDIIVLGTCAYCMEAYQIPTNDNFHFQDGALRDQVDDTAIPKAWLEAAKRKMSQFEARLQEIKHQRDFAASSRVHWGDIAARYPRL